MRSWRSLLSLLTILLFCLSLTTVAFAKPGGGGSASGKGNSSTGSASFNKAAAQTGDAAHPGDDGGKAKGPKNRDGAAHPSLKGLLRAYTKVVANGASPRAQEALRALIERRGGTVPAVVYGSAPSEDDTVRDVSLLDAVTADSQVLQTLVSDEDGKGELTTIADSTLSSVQVLSNKETKGKALKQLGQFFTQIEEPDKAVDALEQSIALNPDDDSAYRQINDNVKTLNPQQYRFYLKGRQPSFDIPPVLENNRLLIPLRAVSESLGAAVQWDAGTQTATIVKDGRKIEIKAGEGAASVDGASIPLEAPGKIAGGNRMVVPLRFIAEALQNDVSYYPESQMVVIK
ncbi:tetratricopeptide repeat protein [Heliobacterium gestii]|uniref:Tetratricopeptide repeat protein n=1 Tax=Heliomicrobium gestii TaxID=2699 RepID=A0A845LJ45_HELGE|nr:stalk domain-containing protein [Heliomicrobium gestii]MBM7866315.1 tetratricopeptide (TPR) repeat protein [Heliomicrobium gestii]MZP42896.1 tetratricopeptide repeat protein [Heliomicrobium gestii]